MEQMLYKLENFEGPLDLLLHLISKNKVSIYDIPICEITDQYLEAIIDIDEIELEYTSEFLLMAAQLLYIKSKMLLPKPEVEEEEDPREELARLLEEYQKFKQAAEKLRKNEFWSQYMVFRQAENIKFPIPEYSRKHRPSELVSALKDISERKERKSAPPKRSFYGIVGREKVAVEDMVEKVCKILAKMKRVRFKNVFKKEDSKPEKIATFLAILEMIKLNKISADYDSETEDFIITGR